MTASPRPPAALLTAPTRPPAVPDPRPGPVLALVGPTAAGKTGLALAVAERLGAEVVSADAMLVYRGMDIGTAKPTPRERARVPHHLVDLVDPGEEFSVARFQPLARAAIAEVLGRGRSPLLVGGSDTLAAVIGVLLAGAFLGGAVVALLRPHAGHQEIETDKEIAQ